MDLNLVALVTPYLADLPWMVKLLLKTVLPLLLIPAVIGPIIKPILRVLVKKLRERTPPVLWPAIGAGLGVLLQLLFKYIGVELSPTDVGWVTAVVEVATIGVVTGGLGAPLVREAYRKKLPNFPKRTRKVA
jgi:drug/metabolite transporter (DMT)-like permease